MPQPTDIKLRTQSRLLDVHFDDGSHFELPFEYLRVFSPSAEVKGHGGGEGVLRTGKQNVGITGVEPVGNYALAPAVRRWPQYGPLHLDPAARAGPRSRAQLGALPGALRRSAASPGKREPFGAWPLVGYNASSRSRDAMDNSDRKVDFGFEKVALGRQGGARPSVFASVAGKYDVMNDLMSFGAAPVVEAIHPVPDRFAAGPDARWTWPAAPAIWPRGCCARWASRDGSCCRT